MPIKTFRPITPSLRTHTKLVNDDLTTDQPHKPLLTVKQRTGGRNSTGRMTIRHQGGGHKQKLRLIDFKRDKYGIPGTVATVEYDPNRNARIALVNYKDGEKRYIIQPVGLKVGQLVMSGPEADILVGNALPLKNIPAGTTVHAIELRPGKGAQMARSAGAAVQLVAKEGDYALLKLPSGETRRVLVECMATIGQVGNTDHENQSHRQGWAQPGWRGFAPRTAACRRLRSLLRPAAATVRPPADGTPTLHGASRHAATRHATTNGPMCSS